MENEVDLSSGNPLDLTPRGPLAGETVTPIPVQNIEPARAIDLSGRGKGLFGSNRTMYQPQLDGCISSVDV